MDNIRPIRSHDDYLWAIAEITKYFEAEPTVGSPDSDRFDLLADLIEAYEDKHFPILATDPIKAISAHMELKGLKQSDLAHLVGSKSRASEILNRKRKLTIDMVHNISSKWNIPADILVNPYHLTTDKDASEVRLPRRRQTPRAA